MTTYIEIWMYSFTFMACIASGISCIASQQFYQHLIKRDYYFIIQPSKAVIWTAISYPVLQLIFYFILSIYGTATIYFYEEGYIISVHSFPLVSYHTATIFAICGLLPTFLLFPLHMLFRLKNRTNEIWNESIKQMCCYFYPLMYGFILIPLLAAISIMIVLHQVNNSSDAYRSIQAALMAIVCFADIFINFTILKARVRGSFAMSRYYYNRECKRGYGDIYDRTYEEMMEATRYTVLFVLYMIFVFALNIMAFIVVIAYPTAGLYVNGGYIMYLVIRDILSFGVMFLSFPFAHKLYERKYLCGCCDKKVKRFFVDKAIFLYSNEYAYEDGCFCGCCNRSLNVKREFDIKDEKRERLLAVGYDEHMHAGNEIGEDSMVRNNHYDDMELVAIEPGDDINHGQNISDNIAVYGGSGTGSRPSKPANNKSANNNNTNNNNHHHNSQNNDPFKQNNNDDDNDEKKNNPNKTNEPPSSDSSLIPQRGDCPFCSTSNMSFKLYLVHCNMEHPEIGYDWKLGDVAVKIWKDHNKFLSTPQSRKASTSTTGSINTSKDATPSAHSTETPNDEKKQDDHEIKTNREVQLVQTTPTASTTVSFSPQESHSTITSDDFPHSTQSIECNELCNDDKNKKNSVWSYEPNQGIRVRRNIYVPRELTSGKDSDMYGLYEWMDKTIAMQFKNKQNELNQGSKIFNLKGKYAIIEPMNEDVKDVENTNDKRKHYPWNMRSKLYTKEMICNKFRISKLILPKPVRQSETFEAQLNQGVMLQSLLNHPDDLDKLINSTKWCRIDVFSAAFSRRLNNKRRTTLSITKTEFMNDLKDKNNFDEMHLIPILMFKHNDYKIHHLMVVQIDNVNLGISLIHEQQSKIAKVTGIHIERQMIYKQHGWISSDHMDECKCLDNFNTSINNLEIGDLNDAQNQINALKKRINMLEIQLKKANK